MAIITISRGTMSGGRAVAECLSTRLGYPCVAREILQGAARTLGATEETIQRKLQTPPGPLDRLTGNREVYVAAVRSALAEHCVSGNLVYHGLAGQLLLRDVPGVLRVRLIAPMAMRVTSLLSRHQHTTRDAAERYIRSVDRQRRRWVRRVYGVDVTDTALYELTINLEAISPPTACVMIAELAQQPHYAVTPDVRERLAVFAAECRDRVAAITGSRPPTAAPGAA